MKVFATALLQSLLLTAGASASFARTGIDADHLAVIVNAADPESVAIGAYYQDKRNIPASNVIRVRMPHDSVALSESEFAAVRQQVERQLPSGIEAYALTWLKPYRVECMSITSAFAFGFKREFCAEGCRPTRVSPYFNSSSRDPAIDFGVRPAMSIASIDIQHARQLIDRGVASDGMMPRGTAYLLNTSDKARNVRAARYELAETMFASLLKVRRINADVLADAPDVMFYFTGRAHVDQILTDRFLPGAVADHLTSTAGDLINTDQMSSLRWLEAGATGSYGTVVEPCNFTAKFPDPVVLMAHYLAGETLIEAYWKSVAMPGQGLFIGEPLARPYATAERRLASDAPKHVGVR